MKLAHKICISTSYFESVIKCFVSCLIMQLWRQDCLYDFIFYTKKRKKNVYQLQMTTNSSNMRGKTIVTLHICAWIAIWQGFLKIKFWENPDFFHDLQHSSYILWFGNKTRVIVPCYCWSLFGKWWIKRAQTVNFHKQLSSILIKIFCHLHKYCRIWRKFLTWWAYHHFLALSSYSKNSNGSISL